MAEVEAPLSVAGERSGEGLGDLPSHDETLGGPSSRFTLLVVFVYGDVNMTGLRHSISCITTL